MSYIAGVILASVLFAAFGLFWRGPRDTDHATPGREECDSCPLAGPGPRPRHLQRLR